MNVIRGCCWALSVGALALVGCVPGYNSMVFATKTNAGLVVDTKPPEVNVDIGRFEGLFAPTYEAGKTPPVMASFRFDSNKGFLSNYIGSAFTTGDAAVAMSRLYDTPDDEALHKANKVNLEDDKAYAGAHWKKIEKNYDSAVDLAMVPKQPWFVPKEEPGAVRPVLFATDTSFGFKVAWQTAESPLPDYLRLAYQRREIAFAAVTVGPKLKVDPSGETAPQALNGLEARVPSLLATVDAQVRANEFINSDFSYLQYFASGSAATALAMRRGVRDAMLHRLDPEAAPSSEKKVAANQDPAAIPRQNRIATWLADAAVVAAAPTGADAAIWNRLSNLGAPVTQGAINREKLKEWLRAINKFDTPGDEVLWMADKRTPIEELDRAIEALQIP